MLRLCVCVFIDTKHYTDCYECLLKKLEKKRKMIVKKIKNKSLLCIFGTFFLSTFNVCSFSFWYHILFTDYYLSRRQFQLLSIVTFLWAVRLKRNLILKQTNETKNMSLFSFFYHTTQQNKRNNEFRIKKRKIVIFYWFWTMDYFLHFFFFFNASFVLHTNGTLFIYLFIWYFCRSRPLSFVRPFTHNINFQHLSNNILYLFFVSLFLATSTQNGHKGIQNQGDATISSPARRSEVSPIQSHVSVIIIIVEIYYLWFI